MPVIATLFSIALGLLRFFEVALFIWVILSWVPLLTSRSQIRWRYRGFFSVLDAITNFLGILVAPLLRLCRRILPRRVLPREWGAIDLSPIVAFILIELARALIVWLYRLLLFA